MLHTKDFKNNQNLYLCIILFDNEDSFVIFETENVSFYTETHVQKYTFFVSKCMYIQEDKVWLDRQILNILDLIYWMHF